MGLLFANTDSQAKGSSSVMFDTEFDKATLWHEFKPKFYFGLGMDLDSKGDDTEITPAIRYYLTSFSDLQVFASVEMPGLFGDDDKRRKSGKDDNGFGDFELSFGAEYFFQRNFSVVAHFYGGGGINFQYYF